MNLYIICLCNTDTLAATKSIKGKRQCVGPVLSPWTSDVDQNIVPSNSKSKRDGIMAMCGHTRITAMCGHTDRRSDGQSEYLMYPDLFLSGT